MPVGRRVGTADALGRGQVSKSWPYIVSERDAVSVQCRDGTWALVASWMLPRFVRLKRCLLQSEAPRLLIMTWRGTKFIKKHQMKNLNRVLMHTICILPAPTPLCFLSTFRYHHDSNPLRVIYPYSLHSLLVTLLHLVRPLIQPL